MLLDMMPERFRTKVVVQDDSDCWLWTGALHSGGYGAFKHADRWWASHRLSYTLTQGDIPPGLLMDHFLYPAQCIGPSCCNPMHVRPVTVRENNLRSDRTVAALNAAKTHCVHGHALDEANTYRDSSGHRGCRTCRRAQARTDDANARRRARNT